jgi:RHS repeat-associated protein
MKFQIRFVAGNDTTNKFWRYEYDIKDHLGNLRVACRCAEQAIETKPQHTYAAIVVQQATYDPWGIKLNTSTPADAYNGNPTDRYRYNGKEYQKDHGLYEYGFRWYDAAIARFIQVDPLANDYAYKSTYDYAENEPIVNLNSG